MTHRRSVGLLVYRRRREGLEVLLMHPGGPHFKRRDHGAWSIPKGEVDASEEDLACARREFAEEIGQPAPEGEYLDLGEIRQRSGKFVHAFAVAGDLDVSRIESNTFLLEWPPHSGTMREFPEADRAQWFLVAEAKERVNLAQCPLIDQLVSFLEET